MVNWRSTFDALESAAEHGNAGGVTAGDQVTAKAALAFISDTIEEAFRWTRSGRLACDPLADLKLDGADPCERVAEALAVWIVESDFPRFADILAAYDMRSALPHAIITKLEAWEAEQRESINANS